MVGQSLEPSWKSDYSKQMVLSITGDLGISFLCTFEASCPIFCWSFLVSGCLYNCWLFLFLFYWNPFLFGPDKMQGHPVTGAEGLSFQSDTSHTSTDCIPRSSQWLPWGKATLMVQIDFVMRYMYVLLAKSRWAQKDQCHLLGPHHRNPAMSLITAEMSHALSNGPSTLPFTDTGQEARFLGGGW